MYTIRTVSSIILVWALIIVALHILNSSENIVTDIAAAQKTLDSLEKAEVNNELSLQNEPDYSLILLINFGMPLLGCIHSFAKIKSQ